MKNSDLVDYLDLILKDMEELVKAIRDDKPKEECLRLAMFIFESLEDTHKDVVKLNDDAT